MIQKTVSKSQLKVDMPKIFRELELNGGEIIVTDHNTAVLRIVPFKQHTTIQELFGGLQGQVVYYEDINTPTSDQWEET